MLRGIAFLLFTTALLISSMLKAQPNWGWDVAASGGYAKNLDALGPQVRAYILINEAFCYGLEYSRYSFKHHDELGTFENGIFDEVSLNAHYVFHLGHKFGVYPIAGLNWSLESIEGHQENAFGLNAGAGFHVFAGKWVPYLEYLYTSGDLTDQKFIIGTYFIIRDIGAKRGL